MIQINLPNLRSQGDEATEKKITIWSLKMPPFGAHILDGQWLVV